MKMVVILILALSLAGAAWAADPPNPAVCPVMGGKANPNIHTDYQGQRVYFCCQGCPGVFQKNPGKYLQQPKEQHPGAKPGNPGQ